MDPVYDVLVVGSCMIDLISYVPRLPSRGETLHGTKFSQGFGGKGANQCVAAAFLNSKTALVARVGSDSFGEEYIKKLKIYGIDDTFMKIEKNASTGMAQILVEDSGENQIVIVGGANDLWSDCLEPRVIDAITKCKVLVCQNEIKEEMSVEALKIKSESHTGISIFNAAPAKSNLNPKLLSLPDIFCVNETESEIVLGLSVKTIEDAKQAVNNFLQRGCKQVIITLGSLGSIYGTADLEPVHIEAPHVKSVVDTTGAGDAFIGALTHFIAQDPKGKMQEKIRNASIVASLSVQKPGTQTSFPKLSEVPPLHGSRIS